MSGQPRILQPVLFAGLGSIVIGADVELGWPTSALFYAGYSHIEAATPDSRIELGDGVQLNNNAFLKSEGPGITIGAHALLGSNVEILDSDFHELRPGRRRGGRPRMAAVRLGENVFVGDGVKILKGVSVGDRSVIGAGSVLTRPIPAGVIAAGNPARVIAELPAEEEAPRDVTADACDRADARDGIAAGSSPLDRRKMFATGAFSRHESRRDAR